MFILLVLVDLASIVDTCYVGWLSVGRYIVDWYCVGTPPVGGCVAYCFPSIYLFFYSFRAFNWKTISCTAMSSNFVQDFRSHPKWPRYFNYTRCELSFFRFRG